MHGEQTTAAQLIFTGSLRLDFAAQLGTSDALESKFKALEGDDVDAELAAMRRGMVGGARARPSLPEGRPIRCAAAFLILSEFDMLLQLLARDNDASQDQ